MKVINLFGAPGAGKSTTMLGLTYKMKIMGLSVENTPEFYKELILEGSDKADFGGQLVILGEQNRRLARLIKNNDFAVTDCPLPLIGFYAEEDYINGFHNFVQNLYEKYDNAINYFIIRKHEFENEKRIHDEETSDLISKNLPIYLDKYNINYKFIESGDTLVDDIISDLIEKKIITNEQLNNSRNPEIRKKYSNI